MKGASPPQPIEEDLDGVIRALGDLGMRADDLALVRTILSATHPEEILRLIDEYWSDDARIHRAPRALMVMHLGLVVRLAQRVYREVGG